MIRHAFRFVSGRPMDGHPRTDSQFLLAGTRSVRGTVQRPSRWSMLPGWHRAGWRLLSLLLAVVGPWLWWSGRRPVLAALVAVVLAAGWGWSTWRAVRAVRRFRHVRAWVRPLHRALLVLVGWPASKRAEEWLTVPRDLHTNPDAVVRVELPPAFASDPGRRRLVAETVAAKLALPDVDNLWHVEGRQPHLLVRQAPQPPRRALFADVREAMGGAAESAPILGLGVRSRVETIDLDTEAPHLLFAGGTGSGKSVFCRLVASQILASGGIVVVLDLKRVSHSWLNDVGNVAYLRHIEDIHKALIAVGAEGERRFSLIERDGDDGAAHLPRVLVIFEELNATVPRLGRYWGDIRDPKSDPKRSPALTAFGDGVFLGRQARINYLCVAQYATSNATAGPEIRENFGVRVLSRYSANAAKMLCPEVKLPPSSRIPGRAQVYRGGEAHATQLAHLSADEAAEWVRLGQERRGLTDLPRVGSDVARLLAMASGERGAVPAPRPGGLRLVTPPAGIPIEGDALVGLAVACAPGGVLAAHDVSLAAARRASSRDPVFPESAELGPGGERLYRPADLERWQRNRPRAGLSAPGDSVHGMAVNAADAEGGAL